MNTSPITVVSARRGAHRHICSTIATGATHCLTRWRPTTEPVFSPRKRPRNSNYCQAKRCRGNSWEIMRVSANKALFAVDSRRRFFALPQSQSLHISRRIFAESVDSLEERRPDDWKSRRSVCSNSDPKVVMSRISEMKTKELLAKNPEGSLNMAKQNANRAIRLRRDPGVKCRCILKVISFRSRERMQSVCLNLIPSRSRMLRQKKKKPQFLGKEDGSRLPPGFCGSY